MSLSPVEEAQGRRVGTVEFVSPAEIKVSLDLEAPDKTAINTGNPRSFPRINNYLLVPCEDGFVVGQVEWLAVERSPFPKRKGLQDFGLVDLPFPQRILSLNPVGTLAQTGKGSSRSDNGSGLELKRGVYAFPTVGDSVLLPTDEQLRSIVESGTNRRVLIGHAPLAGNAEVKVDPDRLFGRHLAVLGNTGSGKSCTVAGIIQWCLEEAKLTSDNKDANARFIILDPNGEYSKVFSQANIFKGDSKEQQLKVPLWFWNSEEWASFMMASGRSQRPLLRRALREIRSGVDPLSLNSTEDAEKQRLRMYLSEQVLSLRQSMRSNAIKEEATRVGNVLKAIAKDISERATSLKVFEADFNEINKNVNSAIKATCRPGKDKATGQPFEWFLAFNESLINNIISAMIALVNKLGGVVYYEGPSENTPLPFEGADFADHLEILSGQESQPQFIDPLIIRIRTMLADPQIRGIIGDSKDTSLEKWLNDYIPSSAKGKSVTVVDLSLIPSEIIHVIIAVVARMIFEALQRYRMQAEEGQTLPTVLVMEEAHTFIRRYQEDSEQATSATACTRAFERIAREGRKFGLGLVLSSQRPSELSQTVLSQCNSFLLHRISNDKDQEAVSKLLPDYLRGILRELPVLPTRHAFLIGWASELPVLINIRELPESQQPKSNDPDFWAVWTGKDSNGKEVLREVSWKAVSESWQGKVVSSKSKLTEEEGKVSMPPEETEGPPS